MSQQQYFSYTQVYLGLTSTKLGLMCLAQGHNTMTLYCAPCVSIVSYVTRVYDIVYQILKPLSDLFLTVLPLDESI